MNLLNQWALGVADSYALAVLAENRDAIPRVVLQAMSAPLAARPQFARSVKALRAEGVSVLLSPGGSAAVRARPTTTSRGSSPSTRRPR